MTRMTRPTSYRNFHPNSRVIFSEKYSQDNQESTWTVNGGLSYYVGHRQNENWIYVPHGYRVTGACVPKYFKGWIRPCDQFGQSVIIHEYLCQVGKIRTGGFKRIVSRRQANLIFLESMKILKVPMTKRWVLYLAACLDNNSGVYPKQQ